MREHIHGQDVDDSLRDDLVEFPQTLPSGWQTPIPEQNLAVDGCGRRYQFGYSPFESEDGTNVHYYVNKPINDEFFLTIQATNREDTTYVRIQLSEGSDVVGLNEYDSRGPDVHVIDDEKVEDIESEDKIDQHFEDVTEVIERFAEEYGDRDLEELKRISS